MFDKLVQVLVLGAAYEKVADTTCSATTLRRRRDEWIEGLSRFWFDLPEDITVHLDAGHDSKATRDLLIELGCRAEVAVKGIRSPIRLENGGLWREPIPGTTAVSASLLSAPKNAES